MITIPGSNISIPGGIQIPTSQSITIPSSTGVQMPVSVANVTTQINGGEKNGKEVKAENSPNGQGRFSTLTTRVSTVTNLPEFSSRMCILYKVLLKLQYIAIIKTS